jgi:hypothetical protein
MLHITLDSLDKRPKFRKNDARICTWNAKSLNRKGLLVAVAKELSKRKLDLVGVKECQFEKV